jgi:hypothetical protein
MKKEVGSGPNPVVIGTGTDPGIRIHTKMSRIPNTVFGMVGLHPEKSVLR